MGLKGLIEWAMKQQLRFIKEKEIKEFGDAFLKNINKELGIEAESQEETSKRMV